MTDQVLKVLVIDDEEMIRSTLCDCFEDEGFDVSSAGSSEEGLEVLENEEFDFATVDMRLPGMDGNDFILLAHEKRPDMKFVIYTGSVDYVLPQKLLDIGLTKEDVFLKPVPHLEDIVKALRK
ncbi:MAG: response regulator [Desulfovibrio sp.]